MIVLFILLFVAGYILIGLFSPKLTPAEIPDFSWISASMTYYVYHKNRCGYIKTSPDGANSIYVMEDGETYHKSENLFIPIQQAQRLVEKLLVDKKYLVSSFDLNT